MRSVQSTTLLIFSAPITRMFLACPILMKLSATVSAYTKPVQTACTSNAKPGLISKSPCTFTATEGNVRSGVVVATITPSISSGERFAASMALRAAFTAISPVVSFSAAMWRCLIPLRWVIHSSVVSTIFSSSALVKMRSGRYEPVLNMIDVTDI